MNLKEYLFTLKVQELRQICKDSSICGISKMKNAHRKLGYTKLMLQICKIGFDLPWNETLN